ncbi:WAT1-related protein At5g64700-like isoform X2 [Phoenix dactylifera]|uniref:WAT1-related protein n=1 Tax=Phoenix dactylifera TaxID=42345 RepID=A0A8B8J2W5_PHODC|nr:WAT1-related protein At5g64700-like isoform X2 [Phoenix dactylifera]
MNNPKVYLTVFLVRALYAGFHITAKAALNGGMSAYVFVLYRLVLGTLFLAPFAFALERKAAPPLPFKLCFKIFLLSLFGQETIKLKRLSGIMKVSGVLLCLAGILEMAFYKGPHFKPLNHHHLLGHGSRETNHPPTNSTKNWVLGTFLMTISNATWSLWMVLQVPLLKEYPSKLTFTTLQCLFSAFQSFFIALALERDFSRWKLGLDAGLVSVIYSGIIVTGVAFYLQSWLIEKRGPVFLAMSTPLTLIITIMGSYFILGELVNLGSVLGGLLMVGGLYSVLWGQRREQTDHNTPTEVERKASLDVKENGITQV